MPISVVTGCRSACWRSERRSTLPFVFGVQLTLVGGEAATQISSLLVSSSNTDVALPLCYLSACDVGVMAAAAVIYNLRQAAGPARRTGTEGSAA